MCCPYCKNKSILKRGKRKLRFENVQIYQCKKCKKRFQNKKINNKSYAPQIIYHALILYNQGKTYEETRKQINKRFKIKISTSTLSRWIKEYSKLCPIQTIRNQFKNQKCIIFRKQFEHENLDYEFKYHNYKIQKKVKTKFPNLYQYLKRFEQGCPDTFFEVGQRCSQPLFKTKIDSLIIKKENLACKMADFAIGACRNNYERHDLVEEFMLINDKATVACEIPVWYWEKKVNEGITGHIDILQVRNNLVYILDYKPNAAKDKKAAGQLYHYAVALSFRAKIPFEKICCAWFDHKDYIEFKPAQINTKI